jgi:MOSC domain-containing protein YiiM
MPRTPCQNLSLRIGIEGFHMRFNRTGRVGALLKVIEPGTLAAGDEVEVVTRPEHDVTVSVLATGADAVQLRGLLDSGLPLARKVQRKAQRIVARAERTQGQSGIQQ